MAEYQKLSDVICLSPVEVVFKVGLPSFEVISLMAIEAKVNKVAPPPPPVIATKLSKKFFFQKNRSKNVFKQIQRFEWRKCSLGKTPLQRQFKLEQPQVQIPSFSSFFVGTAIQLVILPPHIPWIGQGGGILLLHYSVICVEAFLIFTR